MTYHFFSIYIFEYSLIFLTGVLCFIYYLRYWEEKSTIFRIGNAIRLIPVVSDFVLAGKQDGYIESQDCISPYISPGKLLMRNFSHRLG